MKDEVSAALKSAMLSKTPSRSYVLYCEDMKSKGKIPYTKVTYYSELQVGEVSEFWHYYEQASRIEKLERILNEKS